MNRGNKERLKCLVSKNMTNSLYVILSELESIRDSYGLNSEERVKVNSLAKNCQSLINEVTDLLQE